MKKVLPIGNDQFRDVRERGAYYVDKTLMIRDFIDYGNIAALITRPRRFGKSLNMTMLRDFFDITQNSLELFNGLAIMNTEYRTEMNTRPVIYLSFKDCSGKHRISCGPVSILCWRRNTKDTTGYSAAVLMKMASMNGSFTDPWTGSIMKRHLLQSCLP